MSVPPRHSPPPSPRPAKAKNNSPSKQPHIPSLLRYLSFSASTSRTFLPLVIIAILLVPLPLFLLSARPGAWSDFHKSLLPPKVANALPTFGNNVPKVDHRNPTSQNPQQPPPQSNLQPHTPDHSSQNDNDSPPRPVEPPSEGNQPSQPDHQTQQSSQQAQDTEDKEPQAPPQQQNDPLLDNLQGKPKGNDGDPPSESVPETKQDNHAAEEPSKKSEQDNRDDSVEQGAENPEDGSDNSGSQNEDKPATEKLEDASADGEPEDASSDEKTDDDDKKEIESQDRSDSDEAQPPPPPEDRQEEDDFEEAQQPAPEHPETKLPADSPSEKTSHAKKRREIRPANLAATRMMMVTDLWERMVNHQRAVCALVLYGLERDFTIVEPFMYESRSINEYSLPEQFREQGMKPQPLSLYFDMSPLFDTGRLMKHGAFRQRIRLQGEEPRFVVNAAVYIPWDEPEENHQSRSYYWCDEKFDTLRWKWKESEYGREIVPGFHVQRLLCLNPFHSMEKDSPADSQYFDGLFAIAEEGTKHLSRQCEECISVMVINYRKHLWNGVEPHEDRDKFLQKTYLSLLVGKEPQAVARRVAKEALGGKKYVGIQMRTGKAYSLLGSYARFKSLENGHSIFEKWLKECSASLIRRAKKLAQELKGENEEGVSFYIASDMINDGWKGGESASPEVEEMLNASFDQFKTELKDLHWFEPEKFGITQDAMGKSGLVDAAVVYFSDEFVYALPSSFGAWIGSLREQNQRPQPHVVDCMMPEFVETEDILTRMYLAGE